MARKVQTPLFILPETFSMAPSRLHGPLTLANFLLLAAALPHSLFPRSTSLYFHTYARPHYPPANRPYPTHSKYATGPQPGFHPTLPDLSSHSLRPPSSSTFSLHPPISPLLLLSLPPPTMLTSAGNNFSLKFRFPQLASPSP